MKKSTCEFLLEFYPQISELEDLRSTYIANCVLNSFLSYTAVMMNIVTIHAIRKTSTLPKTLKTLLLSLAVSDVGVGLLAQPLYGVILVRWLQQNHPSCLIHAVFDMVSILFSQASFLGVVAVSVDRFLAVHLHFRYQEIVTHKRVVVAVVSVWVFSAFVSVTPLWGFLHVQSVAVFIVGFIGLFLSTIFYIRIYLAVRRHKNQIQAMQVQHTQQTDDVANFARVIKSAVGVFYVHVVFLFCYLPVLFFFAANTINVPSTAMKNFFLFSSTFMFLNSSLNPVIYCWKMRHIRHAIMNILRNMSGNRNRAS